MKPAFAFVLTGFAAVLVAGAADAQTRTVRDTATAYGARLTSRAVPAIQNRYRINNRINSRIDNRIGLRIERYRPDSSNDPTATLRRAQDDKSRTEPVVDPTPDEDGPE